MKKGIFYKSLTLLIALLGLTSCTLEYNPRTMNDIRSPDVIAKRVNKLYKNYGTFEVTDTEITTLGEYGQDEDVDEKYYDNVISCRVHFKNANLPGADITAAHYYVYGTGTFFSSWNEHYESSFFTDYYGQQMNDYYREKLNKYFGSYDFKLIRRSFKYYDISTRKAVFSSFDDFMKRKATDEYYSVFIKCNQDDTLNECIDLFRSEIGDFRTEDNFVEFSIIAEPDLDLDSINTVDDVSQYSKKIMLTLGL